MAATRQTGAPSSLSAAEKARLRLRSAQTTAYLCNNPRPCRYGDRCMFAHSADEQRLFREAYPEGAGAGGKEKEGAAGGYGQPYCHPAKYKTSLCIHWERQGDCRHGASCNFAHGEAELRPQPSFQRPSYTRGSYGFAHSSAGSGFESDSTRRAQLPPDEVPEFDEESAAAAAAAAAAYPEAYRLQLEFDQRRQAADAPSAGAAGAEAAPADQPPPAIHSQDEFPTLGGGGKGAAAGKAGSKAGGACKAAVFEWDGRSVASAGSSPVTVEYGERRLARLAASSSGGSCAASVRSVDASEQDEGGSMSTLRSMHLSAPSSAPSVPSAPPSLASPTKQACEDQEQQQRQEEAQESAAAAGQSWADMADEEEQEAQQAQQQPEERAIQQQEQREGAEPAGPPPLPPPPCPLASSAAPPSVVFTGPPSPSRTHGGAMPPITASRPVAPPPGFALPAGTRPAQPAHPPAAAPLARAPYQPPLSPTAAAAPAQPRLACDARTALLQRVAGPRGVDLSLLPAFLCPLTGQPLKEPVVAADGYTYEKEVITDWLYRQNKEVSPMTGRQMPHRLLLPNDALRTAMGQVAELIRALTG